MDSTQALSFLNCELRIIKAKNLDFLSTGTIFVRYYLQFQTGNNNRTRRIKLNTREIPFKSDPYWNETVCLECSSVAEEEEGAMEKLKQQSVVFELRWRKTEAAGRRLLGKLGGSSKLLMRAEIGWKDVLESPELAIEKWAVASSSTCRNYGGSEDLKPPAIQIGMKVEVPGKAEMMERRRRQVLLKNWNECGCRNGECCHVGGADHDDVFALGAALEAL